VRSAADAQSIVEQPLMEMSRGKCEKNGYLDGDRDSRGFGDGAGAGSHPDLSHEDRSAECPM